MAVSEAFIKAFDSGAGGCIRTCVCGRTHFNNSDEDLYNGTEYSLEELRKKAKDNPDRYVPVDGDVGTTECFGVCIAYNCPCGSMEKQEARLQEYAHVLLLYFKEYAAAKRAEAAALEALRPKNPE